MRLCSLITGDERLTKNGAPPSTRDVYAVASSFRIKGEAIKERIKKK